MKKQYFLLKTIRLIITILMLVILGSKYPQIPCLATDACSLLIKSWRKYINENLTEYDINLSSFSVMDMPFYDNSVDIVTSFIGISSTRAPLTLP